MIERLLALRQSNPARFNSILIFHAWVQIKGDRISQPVHFAQTVGALAYAYYEQHEEHATKEHLKALVDAVPAALWAAATELERQMAMRGW